VPVSSCASLETITHRDDLGIKLNLGNGNGVEWELTAWEWEGMGMFKKIHSQSSLELTKSL